MSAIPTLEVPQGAITWKTVDYYTLPSEGIETRVLRAAKFVFDIISSVIPTPAVPQGAVTLKTMNTIYILVHSLSGIALKVFGALSSICYCFECKPYLCGNTRDHKPENLLFTSQNYL